MIAFQPPRLGAPDFQTIARGSPGVRQLNIVGGSPGKPQHVFFTGQPKSLSAQTTNILFDAFEKKPHPIIAGSQRTRHTLCLGPRTKRLIGESGKGGGSGQK